MRLSGKSSRRYLQKLVRGFLITLCALLVSVSALSQSDDDNDILLLIPSIISGALQGLRPPVLDGLPLQTTQSTIRISGQGSPEAAVKLYRNQTVFSQTVADRQGRFTLSVSLRRGRNSFRATQSVDNETSRPSNTVETIRGAPNLPPSVFISYGPNVGVAPLSVQFDGTRSSDPDGSIVAYAWEFGDGATASGPQVSHVYQTGGAITARLTVTDNRGGTSTAEVPLQITPPTIPPTSDLAYFLSDPTARAAPLTVRFDASGSTDSDGDIVAYQWDVGDGATSGDALFTHTYTTPGTYTVVLHVTDNSGRIATSLTQVDVLEPAAAAFSASDTSGEAPLFVAFDGAGSGGYIKHYEWDFGDGDVRWFAAAEHQVLPQTKLYKAPGTYTATLTVTDIFGKMDSTQQIITVAPANLESILAVDLTLTGQGPGHEVAVVIPPEDRHPAGMYTIDWGDSSNSTGVQAVHQYAASGIYTVLVSESVGGQQSRRAGMRLVVQKELGGLDIPAERYPTVVAVSPDAPYTLTDTSLNVQREGRLKIMPGAQVQAREASVEINGELQLEGTQEQPIVFSSSST
ncbi:MAG: PKD domain-containing protein, partial [Gammaproteobacteria bacterium]|nr:PKD domain-containing protein [Gammaproteobacteria bacterium]